MRILLPLLSALLLLCASTAPALGAGLPVAVSIAPQEYFVKKIGGALVDVTVLVAAGADPHTYEPKPGQMAALAKAKVYFAVGITPFETIWMPRFIKLNPGLTVMHTDADVEKIAMQEPEEHEEHEGEHEGEAGHAGHEGHEHHAGEPDPHIWLAPAPVKLQARAIAQGLAQADPANAQAYAANLTAFEAELDALDAEIHAMLDGLARREFMVFHPSWGYFAAAYGLTEVPVEVAGKEPKPAELAELIEHARARGIRTVFVSPQFSKRSAESIAKEIGGRVVVADSLAADWATNLRAVAKAMAEAMR